MADVQVEHGFTRIADRLLEALCAAPLPARHLRVVLAVLRKTYGYGKKRDRIASTQLAAMTGISERHVRRVLADLVRWGVVTREARPGVTPQIGVAKDFERWGIPAPGEAERVTSGGRSGWSNPGHDVGRPPDKPAPQRAGSVADRGPAPQRAGRSGRQRAGQETERQEQETEERPPGVTPAAEVPEEATMTRGDQPDLDLPGAAPPAPKTSPWVHVLGRLEGEPHEKAAWVHEHLPAIEASAEAEALERHLPKHPDATEAPRALVQARTKAILIARYRAYLQRGDREYRFAETPEQRAALDRTHRMLADEDARAEPKQLPRDVRERFLRRVEKSNPRGACK